MGEAALFPPVGNLLCAYCRESLGESSVQAVLVRPDGRCAAYECQAERYLALHGEEPDEDEALYGFCDPLAAPGRAARPAGLSTRA